jgi:KaiC/GvpD/RAD55 family RecA-like ATPase/YHS domain-containing protein
MGDTDRSGTRRCDFCRLPCPETTHTLDHDGTTYEFCSETCRETMRESDRVFTEYHGNRRVYSGVAGLDAALPQGLPRSSFVLLGGQPGNRTSALQAELVWRALERGEPAVVLSFREPPTSVVERFLSLDWNILPYLESGRLQIVDCFTYRYDDRDRRRDHLCDWNVHIRRFTDEAVRSVRDPGDVAELQHKLDSALDATGMVEDGIVVIDSLTEFGTLVQPVQAYDFVKDVRADVCKGRFVPIFAGATLQGAGDRFPHDLHYIADGIVDLQMNDEIVDDTLIKRVRIRKMSGVLVYPEWVAYEYTGGDGMVTFSPAEEIEDADAAADPAEGAAPDVESTHLPDEAGDAERGGTADAAEEVSGAADGGTEASANDGSDPK